ncbi:MAG: hypothetical protein ACYDH5_01125 [Acidimicrobiales bacterium]
MAKDLIVVMTGDAEEVVVEYDIRLPAEVQDHLRRSEELRAVSAEARAAAAAEISAVLQGSCTSRAWRCVRYAGCSACRTSEPTNS